LPHDHVGRAAFAADLCLPVAQVEVLDVEGKDLAGAGSGLIQQPPQRLLPEANILAV
jgi:hypothetical protein